MWVCACMCFSFGQPLCPNTNSSREPRMDTQLVAVGCDRDSSAPPPHWQDARSTTRQVSRAGVNCLLVSLAKCSSRHKVTSQPWGHMAAAECVKTHKNMVKSGHNSPFDTEIQVCMPCLFFNTGSITNQSPFFPKPAGCHLCWQAE